MPKTAKITIETEEFKVLIEAKDLGIHESIKYHYPELICKGTTIRKVQKEVPVTFSIDNIIRIIDLSENKQEQNSEEKQPDAIEKFLEEIKK